MSLLLRVSVCVVGIVVIQLCPAGMACEAHAADPPVPKTKLAHVGLQLDGGWSFLNHELQEPDAEVVAVAEPEVELLDRVRTKLKTMPRVRFYARYEEMLDEVKPDAVIATLPNSQHLALVRECAKRHVHVWLQKPMATSVKEAREMKQLADRAGIKLMINYFRLWDPAAQSVARHIALGDLGTTQRVVVQAGYGAGHEKKMSRYYLGYFWQPEKQGGGSLIEQGTYGIHWAVWLLRRPTRVFAVAKKLRTDAPFTAEDESWTLMDYPGATAISEGSWSMPDEATEGASAIQIIGSKGLIRMIHGKWTISTKANAGAPQPLDLPEPPRERKNGVAHFVDCIRHDKSIDSPHGAALNVTVSEVTDAAYTAIKTGRPVELSR
jgi:predicted dehydrogenase